jgi:hypothetical protein
MGTRFALAFARRAKAKGGKDYPFGVRARGKISEAALPLYPEGVTDCFYPEGAASLTVP